MSADAVFVCSRPIANSFTVNFRGSISKKKGSNVALDKKIRLNKHVIFLESYEIFIFVGPYPFKVYSGILKTNKH